MKATKDTRDARNDPMKPAPRASRNAMNITPQATGCRIITRVSPLDVSSEAVLKSVDSMWDIIDAGL